MHPRWQARVVNDAGGMFVSEKAAEFDRVAADRYKFMAANDAGI